MTSLVLLFLLGASPVPVGDVPFVKQKTNFCGPAALSSVLAYYGRARDQETIARKIYSQRLRGALITDMEDYAREEGFNTILEQGTVDSLKAEIAQGRPVIVLVDVGFWIVSKPHYLVLFSYDDNGFTAHTGSRPSKRIAYATLKKQWNRMGNTYLVVYR